MSLNFTPWTRYEPLTEQRLVDVGNLLRQTQADCVQLHDTSAGDDVWSLSCRVYSRRRHAISKLAESSDWLAVVRDEQQPAKFTFAIGGIPFRVYHGEANDPPEKFKLATATETQYHQTAFDFGIAPVKDRVLRLAAETDPKTLQVTVVALVEMDTAGNITGTYIVPAIASEGKNVESMRRDGVVLPRATVKPLTQETRKDAERENKSDDAGTGTR